MLFPYKDDNPRILVPYVTYCIIGINVLVFLIQFNLGPDSKIINNFGFIPENFSLITIITSMFLHGGLSHIMGNMWFLWVFGDNVEGVLGHVKYAVFYILCGLAATISQFLITPLLAPENAGIPMVGASGAIAGVLGMYMIRFPHARVHVFAFIVIFFTTFRIPAMFVLGFWFFNQLTNGLGSLGFNTTGEVAWFAHIGGFISGIMLNQAFKHIRFEK